VCGDGTGGGLFVWYDARSYPDPPNIYAQKLRPNGGTDWVKNGVPVANDPGFEFNPVIAYDDSGGGIIAWQDSRPGNPFGQVYAQRLDPTGSVKWQGGGVPIAPLDGNQFSPLIGKDWSGGAILVWQDYRNGGSDIYAQRIDRSGNALWRFPEGVVVCGAGGDQVALSSVTLNGEAYVAWEDYRGGTGDIYIQHLFSDGTAEYGNTGSPVCVAPGDQRNPSLGLTTAGSPIVAWEDYRTPESQVYAYVGTGSWNGREGISPADGNPMCMSSGFQQAPTVISDGNGGALVFWEDYRDGDADIYGQRIDAFARRLWGDDGVAICTVENDQTRPKAVSDGREGTIVVWEDRRDSEDGDLYCQRIDGCGEVQWGEGGFPVCTAPGLQWSGAIASDGVEGVLVVWEDYRAGEYGDIYAQRLNDRESPPIPGPGYGE